MTTVNIISMLKGLREAGCRITTICKCKGYTKYSTLPRGISVYIEPKVGIFSEAEGRGKYSLPRVQYMPIFHKEGF